MYCFDLGDSGGSCDAPQNSLVEVSSDLQHSFYLHDTPLMELDDGHVGDYTFEGILSEEDNMFLKSLEEPLGAQSILEGCLSEVLPAKDAESSTEDLLSHVPDRANASACDVPTAYPPTSMKSAIRMDQSQPQAVVPCFPRPSPHANEYLQQPVGTLPCKDNGTAKKSTEIFKNPDFSRANEQALTCSLQPHEERKQYRPYRQCAPRRVSQPGATSPGKPFAAKREPSLSSLIPMSLSSRVLTLLFYLQSIGMQG